ncbi:MAG: GNAT family N-acetyltransferase [Anaerolineae bacterium]|nr:GNAT family N-acetyltransferase [Anaerolineae bacterium]
MNQVSYVIRPLEREDREWVAHLLDQRWGSTQMVSRGRALYGHLLPGFVAERPLPPPEDELSEAPVDDDETEENPAVKMEKIGLLTYNVEDGECEIVTLDSLQERQGVGTALVDALKAAAKEAAEIKRIWLVTTNDNLAALKFWQKRDFELVTVHRNAIVQARRLKPQIPIIGMEGIPIRDELELEYHT